MPEVVVIDVDADTEVDRFVLSSDMPVPSRGDHTWVDGNGDVAYWVHGVEHDFRNDEVRLMCEPVGEKEFL